MLELPIVEFRLTLKFTVVGDCVLVFTSTLELPSANVSIVPELGFAETIGIDEKQLKIINNASVTEREALACAGVRVRGIGPADNIRGLCRLRRGD